jgi:hypothetical protein
VRNGAVGPGGVTTLRDLQALPMLLTTYSQD